MKQDNPSTDQNSEQTPSPHARHGTHGGGEKFKLYIDGSWIDAGEYRTISDPGSSEPFAQVPQADRATANHSVEAAYAALPSWRALTGMQRGDYLLNVAEALRRRSDDVARDITRENGKPLAQSKGEVAMTIDHLRWFAEEARRAYGRIVPHQTPGKRHLVIRRPVGVVAAIAPWNFPLVLAVRKIAPALAAGCPTILRPAGQTPISALRLAECMEEAGIPRGVFQVIAGPAGPIAKEFTENPRCAKISFTGSTAVGKELIKASAATVTKLSLELGGHAPVLVFGDAEMERAVEGAVITKFRNTGQSCIAANRIYVERRIYEEFLSRFAERTAELKTGHGLEEGVDIGAIVNQEALDNAMAQIRDATDAGARIVIGGKPVSGTAGLFLEPTILADVPANAQCMREETFAPIAPVIPFDSEEEAVTAANDTRYGLAAYVFTTDFNRAFRMMEAIEAGTVCINDSVPATSNAPFGGMKESGLGRELGIEGLDAFLETTHVSIAGLE